MTLKLSKKELEELVHTLAWNDGFGCYTRAGMEKLIWREIADSVKSVIFIDVDDMHKLNDEYGYDEVNSRIHLSLGLRSTDYLAGQWFSGDEFIVFVSANSKREQADPMKLSERLQKNFLKNGISVTVGIAEVRSSKLHDVVKPAFDLVQDAKRSNRRGTINI